MAEKQPTTQWIAVQELLKSDPKGQLVEARGWVKTKRISKNVGFVALNDGSSIHDLQAVFDFERLEPTLLDQIHTGCSVIVIGKLQASGGAGQKVELIADEMSLIGSASPDHYPLQPKKHSMEFLREQAHLRMRTKTMSAVMRIRHGLAMAVHQFFDERGFYYLHSPIITASDAEGAGEMFRVTTLPVNNPPLGEDGQVDFGEDFFGKQTHLTVSGQLEAETGALSMGKVYTFGPTFRAENSNTARHLAEFWMIEPEMAFYELRENMMLAEEFLKYLFSYVQDRYSDDLDFLNDRYNKENQQKPSQERTESGLLDNYKQVIAKSFHKVTYTEAIEVLLASKPHKKGKFKYPISWGVDLQSEHERFLVEKHFQSPVIITDYPREIKAFYMKQNEDGKTVRAMDVLAPGIGEIIGGSQREDDLLKLTKRMEAMNVPQDDLWWYLELRKFGSVPHSGFGLGFERLVQFATGMSNIRDVIPFPRTPNNVAF